MNTQDALDRLLHAKRSNIRGCGIKPPDKCHACDADREAIAKLEADARALWAVRVLDAWAMAGWRVVRLIRGAENIPGGCRVVLANWEEDRRERTKRFDAPTPDAARIAAAEALVAADPSLGVGL